MSSGTFQVRSHSLRLIVPVSVPPILSRPGHLDTRPDVCHPQARPPVEVLDGCRPVAREVPKREFQESDVRIENASVGSPLREKRVGVLLAPARPTADEPDQFDMGHDESKPQAVDLDPGPSSTTFSSFRMSWLPPRRARSILVCLHQDVLVEPQLVEVRADACPHPWPGQVQHPSDVLGQNEVPRRSQNVGPEDGSLSDGLLDDSVVSSAAALSKRPLRQGVLLSLHGTQPTHDLLGVIERGTREALRPATLPSDAQSFLGVTSRGYFQTGVSAPRILTTTRPTKR